MWWLKWRLNANLCEQRRLWLVCTFAQTNLSLRHCTKSLVLPKMAICVLFTPAANTLVSLHICAGKVTGQCDKYQDLLCWQRRLLGVCTFALARLSLRHSTEKSCADSNSDLCAVYKNSECCGEAANLQSHAWAFISVQNHNIYAYWLYDLFIYCIYFTCDDTWA